MNKEATAAWSTYTQDSGGKINLLGLDRQGLEAFFTGMGQKEFRARQVIQWIYQRNVLDFASMTDLGKSLRNGLAQATTLHLPEIHREQRSRDGTVKWLLSLADGNRVETVYIPESDRGTLCVSSQVGCSLNCTFCATARQGFNRNLRVEEIISQLLIANIRLQAMQADGEGGPAFIRGASDVRRPVTNVVMMGMGEPLANFENVVSAMRLMLDDFAFGLSRRRITLSTAGMAPVIDRLKTACPVSLAVSLHAPDDNLRDKLVPLNKKYSIATLLESCRRYVAGGGRQRVTFEYVMLDGINDSDGHAKRLAGLLRDMPCKVNLIPFNPFDGSQFRRSSGERIDGFRERLQAAGIFAVTRRIRGDDIDAACGQLAGEFHDRTKRSRRMHNMTVDFAAVS